MRFRCHLLTLLAGDALAVGMASAVARLLRFGSAGSSVPLASTSVPYGARPGRLVAAPAAIAVLARRTSPGPALSSQERLGREGRRFTIRKFRTMVEGVMRKRCVSTSTTSTTGRPHSTS